MYIALWMLVVAKRGYYCLDLCKGRSLLLVAALLLMRCRLHIRDLLYNAILLGRGGRSVQPSGTKHTWKES